MVIKKQAVTSVKWTSLATVYKAICQLAMLAIAARFLDGEQLGIYAIVLLVVNFCQLFMDMGLGNAIIQADEIKPAELNTLWTITITFGFSLSLLLYFVSPVISVYFERAALTQVLVLICPVFFINALFRVHLAILQKNLQFNIIAITEMTAQTVAVFSALYLLRNGLVVEALLYAFIINISIQGLSYWLFSKTQLRLTLCMNFKELRGYFHFGFFQTASSCVNYFNSQFDVILVGKLLGTEILGGYNLVRQFCFRPAMVINPVLTRVAFPVFTKLRKAKERSKVYCLLSECLAWLNFSFYIFLIVFANEVVVLLFSDKWLHLTELFRLMAIWCMLRSTVNPVSSILMALGRVKPLFYWNVKLLFIIPALIILGAKYGIEGVVYSLIALQVLIFVAHIFMLLKRYTPVEIGDYLSAFIAPLVSLIIIATLIYGIDQVFDFPYQSSILASLYVVAIMALGKHKILPKIKSLQV